MCVDGDVVFCYSVSWKVLDEDYIVVKRYLSSKTRTYSKGPKLRKFLYEV